jgi:GNAT superfamily N-acetyltransferase
VSGVTTPPGKNALIWWGLPGWLPVILGGPMRLVPLQTPVIPSFSPERSPGDYDDAAGFSCDPLRPTPVVGIMRSGTIQIEQFDPKSDPERLRACHVIAMSAWDIDNPGVPPLTFETYAAQWQAFDGSPVHAFLATDPAGRPVGYCHVTLPAKENLSMAFCALTVALDQRRTGTGTALLSQCAGVARAAGRTRLASSTFDDTPGAAFAKAKGAASGHAEILRTLTITAATPDRLAALRPTAEQAAVGYELLSWRGLPPEEHLSRLAVVRQSMEDAPKDEGVEPTVWDADRVREVEENQAAYGIDALTVVARHVASGDLAAYTQIILAPGMPEWAAQQATVVLPAHRGHRLGLLVKIEMMDVLARQAPEVRHVITGNAGENKYMIAINEQLGYKISSMTRTCELEVS